MFAASKNCEKVFKTPLVVHLRARSFVTKNYRPWRSRDENFVILACTVLIQITSMTDRRTDGQTDGQTPRRWLRRAKHSAIARKKLLNVDLPESFFHLHCILLERSCQVFVPKSLSIWTR